MFLSILVSGVMPDIIHLVLSVWNLSLVENGNPGRNLIFSADNGQSISNVTVPWPFLLVPSPSVVQHTEAL